MKITCELVSKAEVDPDDPPLTRHYMCCPIIIYKNGKVDDIEEKTVGKNKKMLTNRRRYEEKLLFSVKRLSCCQIFLGLLILGCQIVPFYFLHSLRSPGPKVNWINIARYYNPINDAPFPGIWADIIILLTGIVGLVAASKNARCLIIAHLVLNSFVVLCSLAAVVIAGIDMGTIVGCKDSGSLIDISHFKRRSDFGSMYNSDKFYYYDNPTTATTTTTPSPVVVWGEEFAYDNGSLQYFHCTNIAFVVWIVMELVIILSSLVAFGLTIGLIVKNSKALSLCCRTCCSVEEENEGEVDEASLLGA